MFNLAVTPEPEQHNLLDVQTLLSIVPPALWKSTAAPRGSGLLRLIIIKSNIKDLNGVDHPDLIPL